MRWKVVTITPEAIESIALVCLFLRFVAAITGLATGSRDCGISMVMPFDERRGRDGRTASA
jgi:hypothetical protein